MKVVVFALLSAFGASALHGSDPLSSAEGLSSLGAKAQSLMQTGSKSFKGQVLQASASQSSSLKGYAQFIETLATRVVGHNYTLNEAEKNAIAIIKKFIEEMVGTIDVQHQEDQAEVDRARDAIQNCSDRAVEGLLTVAGFKTLVTDARTAHEHCRVNESHCVLERSSACVIYDEYRMTTPAEPPTCIAPWLTEHIATQNANNLTKVEHCLDLTHAWLEPLYAKYILCNDLDEQCASERSQCNFLQAKFESGFCLYALKLADVCQAQSTCRETEIGVRGEVHSAVELSVSARKADFETGRIVLCLLQVFESNNTNKASILEGCQALSVDTSAYAIEYHDIPTATVCVSEPDQPCDSNWVTSMYGARPWSENAPADTCTPCITQPEPEPEPNFEVVGDCIVDGVCVTSLNFPEVYPGDSKCTVTPAETLEFTIEHFETEQGRDVLTVNGIQYSGDTAPPTQLVTDAITWSTDKSGSRSGWRICLEVPSVIPVNPVVG